MAVIGSLTSTAASGFAIGRNGSTNPVLQADCSVASAATGVKVTGQAAGSGAGLATISSGTNEALSIDAKGTGTVTINGTATGNVVLARPTVVTGTTATTLAVGPNGATNPALQVDASASSAATGVKVTAAAAASGVALAAVSSGTNEALSIDAKGSGTLTLAGVSTGTIGLGSNVRVADTKTFGLLDTGTATAASGAATLDKSTGKITTEALTTAAGAAYTLTLTNARIAAADIVMATVANGTNTQGIVMLGRVTPAAGSVAIIVRNMDAAVAFNGTLVISYMVIKVV